MTFPGIARAHLARIHLRATRAWCLPPTICGRMDRSPAVRECFVSTQRTWPVPQPMWLVECVEILRFLLVSWCLRGVHVRCVDTAHQSATPVGNHCTEIPVNSSSGAKCFLTLHLRYTKRSRFGLNAPSGARCFLAPASGSGVVAPLPGAGASPRAPRGAGRHRPYLTTFRRPEAKRHRRPFGSLQLPTSDDVKPKDQRSDL